MPDSVDDRVVAIKFDNRDFENKIADTIRALDKLDHSLSLADAGKTFDELSTAADGFDLSGIGDAVDNISGKFSALGAIGFSIISNLTESALNFAKKTAGALLDPLIAGGKERALNIEQAKFQFRNLGLDVEKSMGVALEAVKGTSFGLGDAAKAAAQLGASGIEVGGQMGGILRAIAGSAAMTGSSFGEISQIFTASAASGKINTMDLQQFSTRGLNAAAAVAKVLGKTEAQVRSMASSGKLDFKTFADAMDKAFGDDAKKANETYSGSLANLKAAFSRIGADVFTETMRQERDIFNALTPVIDKVHDALKPLIVAFTTMTGLDAIGLINKIANIDLTNFSNSIPGFVSGFSDIFKSIHDIAKSISAAFHDVFPPSAESRLVTFSKVFGFLIHVMTPTPEVLDQIKRIFHGVFSVVSIGIEIIKNIGLGFLALFKIFKDTGAAHGILEFFAKIGDKLFELKQKLVDAGGIRDFFLHTAQVVGGAITEMIAIFNRFKDVVVAVVDQVVGKFTGVSDGADKLKNAIKNLVPGGSVPSMDSLGEASGRLGDRFGFLSKIGEKLGGAFETLSSKLQGPDLPIGDFFKTIGEALKSGDYNLIVDALNVGVFAFLISTVRKFIDSGFKASFSFDFGKGLLANIKDAFGQLTGVLDGMQSKLRAEALLKIAIAIAVLTGSLLVLSLIDSVALTKALVAIGVGFGQLVGVMELLKRIGTDKSTVGKIGLMIAGLIGLGIAIGILSISVLILSRLSFVELAKGLGGIAALLGIVTLAVKYMPKNKHLRDVAESLIVLGIAIAILSIPVLLLGRMDLGDLTKGLLGIAAMLGIMALAAKYMPDAKSLTSASLGISAMGFALLQVAFAVQVMGNLDGDQLVKGLIGLAGSLAIIIVAVKNMPNSLDMIDAGIGIVAISIALVVLSQAVRLFGSIPVEQMIQGLIGVGIALAFITIAAKNMPPDMVAMGFGLAAIGLGLIVVAKAVEIMGNIELDKMVQGLVGIAVALAILAIAAYAMQGTLIGSAAIIVAAGALLILAFAMKAMSDIPFTAVLIALGAFALVIGAIALGAVLLSEAIPFILALGVALLVFGLGLAAIGLAAAAFGLGLLVIGNAITVLANVGSDNLNKFLELLPKLLVGIATAVLEAIKAFLEGTPEIIELLGKIIDAVAQLIIDKAPKVKDAVVAMLKAFGDAIVESSPGLIFAGFFLILKFLEGLDHSIGEITSRVVSIITKFLDELAKNDNIDKLAKAGAGVLVAIANGVKDNLGPVSEAVGALVNKIYEELGKFAKLLAIAGFGVIVRIVEGIGQGAGLLVSAAVQTIIKFGENIKNNILLLANAGFFILIGLLNGLSDAVDKNGPLVRGAAIRLVLSILNGITSGFGDFGYLAVEAIKIVARNMMGGIFGIFESKSPSRAMIRLAGYIADGLVIGLDSDKSAVSSANDFGNRVFNTLTDTLTQASTAMLGMDEFNPTIAPVLDLTNIEKGAARMDALLPTPTIDASVSFSQAAALAVANKDLENRPAPVASTDTKEVVKEVNYNQTINSPTALSTADIYRGTRSQISFAKKEIGVS